MGPPPSVRRGPGAPRVNEPSAVSHLTYPWAGRDVTCCASSPSREGLSNVVRRDRADPTSSGHVPNVGMARTIGHILAVHLLGHRRTCRTSPIKLIVGFSLIGRVARLPADLTFSSGLPGPTGPTSASPIPMMKGPGGLRGGKIAGVANRR